MDENTVKVIKIGRNALFEFIYENFVEQQETLLGEDPVETSNFFEIDWERGEFIFCAIKDEDENGTFLSLPKGVDLKKLLKVIPDTIDSLYEPNGKCWREFKKNELESFCSGTETNDD